jgi:hypothetical protein
MDLVVVNCYISAELPWPQDDPTGRLTDIVRTMIVYGPCGAANPNAPCMVAGTLKRPLTCLKRFLKPFYPATVVHDDGYP